jgi:hypothetical protein
MQPRIYLTFAARVHVPEVQMGRPHIEFINALDVAPRWIADGPFEGVSQRLLSEDDESGAYTAIVFCPAGWRGDLRSFGRPVELFGLRGEIEVGGRRLGEGCYTYLRPTEGERRLHAAAGAHLLLMVEEATADRHPLPVHVMDTGTMRWQASLAPGLSVKWLRIDGETGDRSWVSASCSRKQENRAEVHPTIEECVMLRGDCLLGAHGEMTPGSYFWRPPYVPHGPLCTRNGAMYFFRTKGGDFDTTYQEVPGWEDMVRDYFAREPYLDVDLSHDVAALAAP